MKIIDLIILCCAIASGWLGYKKGLLMEIVQLFALFLGLFIGFKLMDKGIEFVTLHLKYSGMLLPIIGYVFIFFAIYFLVIFVGKIFKWTINKTIFGFFDKLAGLLLGISKIFLVLVMFLYSIQKYSFLINGEWFKNNSDFCKLIITNLPLPV